MHVLTATTATQGQHPSDFSFTDDGELVTFPTAVCDNPSCGCGHSFVGIRTRRGTTTAVVQDLELSMDAVVYLVRESLAEGWGELMGAEWVDAEAVELAEAMVSKADELEPGTIVDAGLRVRS